MEQTVENFHGCYLLRSENQRFKGRTYIGYTVDPNRRQKQHNLGRKHGGAVRTASKGPWYPSFLFQCFLIFSSHLWTPGQWLWSFMDFFQILPHYNSNGHGSILRSLGVFVTSTRRNPAKMRTNLKTGDSFGYVSSLQISLSITHPCRDVVRFTMEETSSDCAVAKPGTLRTVVGRGGGIWAAHCRVWRRNERKHTSGRPHLLA